MRPTRWRDVLVVVVVTAALTWGLLLAAYNSLPPLPSNVIVSLGIVAVVGVATVLNLRSRLLGLPGARPATPMQVARFAALGKALSIAGAILVGVCIGVVARVLDDLAVAAYSHDAVTAAIAIAPSLVIGGSGLALERLCRAEEPAEEDDDR